jgi:hypothetical protein
MGNVSWDPTTGEYVGEFDYPDADQPHEVRRMTGWFATVEEADRFSRTGRVA